MHLRPHFEELGCRVTMESFNAAADEIFLALRMSDAKIIASGLQH
jgi:hypothetical protein